MNDLCPCGSGKPLKKCCYDNLKVAVEVFESIRQMSLPLTYQIKDKINEVRDEVYPEFHREVLKNLRGGGTKVVEIGEIYKGMGFKSLDGERYWCPEYDFLPLEKRFFFVFNFKNLNLALPSHLVARNFPERMATLNVGNEEEFEKNLRSVKIGEFLVEGYKVGDFTIMAPVFVFNNVQEILKYTHRMIAANNTPTHFLYIQNTNYRNLKRYFPDLNFSYYDIAAVLRFVSVDNINFLISYSYSWSRADVVYQFFESKSKFKDALLFKWDNNEPSRFFRPEGEPKPLTYNEVARFYENIEDYDVDGKSLGSLRETDTDAYKEAIKTFAFIESLLSKWKAPAYPYKSILKKL